MKIAKYLSILSLVLAIGSVAGCGFDETQPIQKRSQQPGTLGGAVVNILANGVGFSPNSVTVAAGDAVTWENLDSSDHSVVFDTLNINSGIITVPGFSHPFDTQGTFTYHCGLHPTETGTVIVTESEATSDADPIASPSPSSSPSASSTP